VPFPLQDDERVIELVRRHWFFLWPQTILFALFALVPLIVAGWLLSWADVYDNVGTIFWIISAVWLLYWAVRALLNWYKYHNDIWVITNQRIVDSLKTTPFNHRISSADLVNVQDMSVHRRGIMATALNFGDIDCKTASEGGNFVLSGIPRPQDVQLLVDRERDRERKGR
jgi:hypothetical protein